jgi:hypothetical protein
LLASTNHQQPTTPVKNKESYLHSIKKPVLTTHHQRSSFSRLITQMKSFAPLYLSLLCVFRIVSDSQGFIIPSKHTKVAVGNAALSSPLFRRPISTISKKSRQLQIPLNVPPSMTKIQMSEEKEEEKPIETTEVSASESDQVEGKKTKEKERSGFLTALVLGPPLLAKFGIVLLVKFLTDLVVFPLLFLYRIIKSLKNKIVGLFVKKDTMKGDGVNGNSSS